MPLGRRGRAVDPLSSPLAMPAVGAGAALAAGLGPSGLPAGLAAMWALGLHRLLAASAAAARAAAMPTPLAGELRSMCCWTDGSAVHPLDPLLRRAARAVVRWTGTAWAGRSGPCPGEQMVARAELAAAVWVGEAAADRIHIVSDCLSVLRGSAAIAAGRER